MDNTSFTYAQIESVVEDLIYEANLLHTTGISHSYMFGAETYLKSLLFRLGEMKKGEE